eukprot:4812588-Amphidinium_carterae.1
MMHRMSCRMSMRNWQRLQIGGRQLATGSIIARLSNTVPDAQNQQGTGKTYPHLACGPEGDSKVLAAEADCAVLLGALCLGLGAVTVLIANTPRSKRTENVPFPLALQKVGAFLHPAMRIGHDFNRGMGLVLVDSAPKGSVLLRIPARALLTGSTAKSILGPALENLDPEAALGVLLAEARLDADQGGDVLGLR